MKALNHNDRSEIKTPLLSENELLVIDVKEPQVSEYDLYLQKKFELDRAIALLNSQIKKFRYLLFIGRGILIGALLGISVDMLIRGTSYQKAENLFNTQPINIMYQKDDYFYETCTNVCPDIFQCVADHPIFFQKRSLNSGELGFLSSGCNDVPQAILDFSGSIDYTRFASEFRFCGNLLFDACSNLWTRNEYGLTVISALAVLSLILAFELKTNYLRKKLEKRYLNGNNLSANDIRTLNWIAQKNGVQFNPEDNLEARQLSFQQIVDDLNEKNTNYQTRERIVIGARLTPGTPINLLFKRNQENDKPAPKVLSMIFDLADIGKDSIETRRKREALDKPKKLARRAFMDATHKKNDDQSLHEFFKRLTTETKKSPKKKKDIVDKIFSFSGIAKGNK